MDYSEESHAEELVTRYFIYISNDIMLESTCISYGIILKKFFKSQIKMAVI